MEKDPTYEKFLTALKHIVEKDWHRKNEALAVEAGLSKGHLSGILSGKKKASYKKQMALIKAVSNLSYENFLDEGANLLKTHSLLTEQSHSKDFEFNFQETLNNFNNEDPNKDKTYRYFQAALFLWIDEMKKTGNAPQKWLSLKTGMAEGTISKYVNPKREKPIPFEQQVSFANACGFEYIEFIQNGKNIVEAGAPLVKIVGRSTESSLKEKISCQVCSLHDELLKKHFEIITKFENKELAAQINEALIRLEKLGGNHSLEDLKEYIDFKIKKEEEKECKDSPNGTTGLGGQ